MKQMLKTTTLIAFFALGMFLSSCSEESTNPSGGDSSKGTVSCKINGNTWTGKSSTFNNILNIDNVSGNQFILDARDENDTRIVFTADGDAPGTYKLDVANNILKAGASLQLMENGSKVIATVDQATITITALDQSSQKASGSFSFTSDDKKYSVTNCTFKDIHFEIK